MEREIWLCQDRSSLRFAFGWTPLAADVSLGRFPLPTHRARDVCARPNAEYFHLLHTANLLSKLGRAMMPNLAPTSAVEAHSNATIHGKNGSAVVRNLGGHLKF
jgi:hypothetical protein